MTETWDDMTARHKRERRDMVEALAASRITQTEASKLLDTTIYTFNNYLRRNHIFWPVKRQGPSKGFRA